MNKENGTEDLVGHKDMTALLDKAARLAGQRIERGRSAAVDLVFGRGDAKSAADAAALFAAAWQTAGLEGSPHLLEAPTPADLPFIAHDSKRGWFLVISRNHDGAWRTTGTGGVDENIADLEQAVCLSLPRRSKAEKPVPSAFSLVRAALWSRKSVIVDAVMATGLISMLTLATSLYALQVYDRVIPSQGYQTLLVLTVGSPRP